MFGGAALNTKENLAIVGNAAAATGQNIGDVSFWFARAYSAIQNGQPFGEAAQNLQQMGVMLGDTVVKLNALKAAQQPAGLAVLLVKPQRADRRDGEARRHLDRPHVNAVQLVGAAHAHLRPATVRVAQAPTRRADHRVLAVGPIDAVGQLGSAFASMLGPAIRFVAGTVIPGVVSAIEYIAPAVLGAVDVLLQIAGVFMDLAGQAMGWGENIVSQLAADDERRQFGH